MNGKGNHGIARKTRPCPFCGRPIYKGEPIARTRMGWVHEDCRLGVHRHIQEVRRLAREYQAVGQRAEGGMSEED